MPQIKKEEIKKHRNLSAKKSKYICPICKAPMTGRVVLDHCHDTGSLRDAICNACNRAEGKVKKTLEHFEMRKIASKDHLLWKNPAEWLNNLGIYLKKHKNKPSKFIHPTYNIKKRKNG